MRTGKRVWVAVLAAAGLGALALLGGGADRESKGAPPSGDVERVAATPREGDPAAAGIPAGERKAPPGRAGVRAVVDPVTGELVTRPTPEMLGFESTDPEAWLRKYSRDLIQMPLPGGGYIVDLEGRFQTSVVATVAEDGTIEADCVASGGEEGRHDH